jgi:membrane fusion protein, multidrug efflux system
MSYCSRRNLTLRRLLLGLALPVALAACSEQSAAPTAMPAPAVDVVTLRVAPLRITRELPGRAAASKVAEVRPQVSGIVQAQLFDEGSLVSAGQPLYQLDDAVYRADLASARAAVAGAEAALEAARLRARRAAEMARVNAISAQDNETAIATARQAEAELAAARAAVRRRQLDVAHARISAPIDGRIGTSAVTAGALVTADQPTPLAIIQQLDPIHVDIRAPVDDLIQFRRAVVAGLESDPDGFPVDIVLPDGSRHGERGRVRATDLNVDPATGSYSLRVLVPNPGQALLPGMFVSTVAELGLQPDALLAPQRAISRDPKGNATALVVDGDGMVAQRTVQTAQAVGDQWLVTAGLAPGDRVIVAGLQKVRPGIKVDASEAAAASIDRADPADGTDAAADAAADAAGTR